MLDGCKIIVFFLIYICFVFFNTKVRYFFIFF